MKSLLQNRKQWIVFALMLGVICFLNTGYCLLKSARNTLAVVDLGKDAGLIPFFELFGAMPASVGMVFLLTYLLNRYSMIQVFWLTLLGFLFFFITFTNLVYPAIPTITQFIKAHCLFQEPTLFANLIPKFFSMLFFSMAELWKVALLTVLFWGFINQRLEVEEAKKMYAPLMLGTSLGTMLSSPIIQLCTHKSLAVSWSSSLSLMMLFLLVTGLLAGLLYTKLWHLLSPRQKLHDKTALSKPVLSVKEGVKQCLASPYLFLLGWITIADYIAYALGEVIFFDILKYKFPNPIDYFSYHSTLSFWNGLLTAISALILTPYLLKNHRWIVSSIATPLCLFITQIPFFTLLWTQPFDMSLDLLIGIGSIFYAVVRAAKYTLFDTSKELSFLLLPSEEKTQGKLIIDGMCSRIGRSGASFISLALIAIFGSTLASSAFTGSLALIMSSSCLFSTLKLGRLVDQKEKAPSIS